MTNFWKPKKNPTENRIKSLKFISISPPSTQQTEKQKQKFNLHFSQGLQMQFICLNLNLFAL